MTTQREAEAWLDKGFDWLMQHCPGHKDCDRLEREWFRRFDEYERTCKGVMRYFPSYRLDQKFHKSPRD